MIIDKPDGKEYDEIIQRVYNHKPDELTIEKLSAVIIHLDGIAKSQKTKRLAVEKGMEKMLEEYVHYQNMVYFRDYQLKQLRRIVTKAVNKAFEVVKLIPEEKKFTRCAALRYLKKLRSYKYLLCDYIPKEDKKDASA